MTLTHALALTDQGTHETKFKPKCGFFNIKVVNFYQETP